MCSSVGRFNLRTRKSLKLNGQIECNSCKRYYFPPENVDEDDDDNEVKTKQICCDCEDRQQQQPPAKRQRKSRATVTAIKQEPITLIPQPPVYYDQHSNQTLQPILSIEKENTQNVDKKTNSGCMVQIHSIELLSNSPIALTTINPRQVKVETDKIANKPTDVIKCARPKRALRNKTNNLQPTNAEEPMDEKTPNIDEHSITGNDTEDSLRVKFPNATPYEFEFLMFLKSTIVEK